MNIVEKLLVFQQKGLIKIPHVLLAFLGLEIPHEVIFPKGLGGVRFVHRATGTVFHPRTEIRRNVIIFQNVTIGRSRPWEADCNKGGCVVEDDVIICAGAKILFKDTEVLRVGRGTVVGANSVLLNSTGEYEIWAGIPAKKVGVRSRKD